MLLSASQIDAGSHQPSRQDIDSKLVMLWWALVQVRLVRAFHASSILDSAGACSSSGMS